MVLSREKLFQSIKERLEILAFSISNSGPLNLNNGAVLAENFYRDLLNLIYGWQLGNANFGDQNAADIDLADPDRHIFIQVTARNDRKKISDTLDSFYKKPENAGRRLSFIFISKEAGNYKPFSEYKDKFDPAKDITDIRKLLKKINDLPTESLEKVDAHLKREIKIEGEKGGGSITSASGGSYIIQDSTVIFEGSLHDQRSKVQDQRPTGVDQKFYPAPFIPDLKYFVGREELLANLRSTLDAHHKASIHDISGLGKTFACYKFADDNKEKYSTIFFVNAAKEAMMGSLAGLGLMLDPSLKDAPQEQQAMAFKNWLEVNEGWLAIYDNVDESAALKPFVPNNTKGDCLFTSNDPKIRNLGNEVLIEELEPENAAKLLFRRSKANKNAEVSFVDDLEQTAFWQIVRDLDGLPVALNTTGAFIEQQGISYAEYLENLEAYPDLNLELGDEFDPYKKTVLQAFALAIDANTNQGNKFIDEAVGELYHAAALIAPDDIHEEFLRGFLEQNNEEFAASQEQNILWQRVRKQFQGFDLFKYNSSSKSFSTHRLIQKCIQSRLGDARNSYCEKVLNLLKDFFPKYDYNNKPECERYYQHTVTALENADKVGFEAGVSVTLYYRLARFQEIIGNYGQAVEFGKTNLEIVRKLYGKEHSDTAHVLNNLARIYSMLSRYDEAIELFEKAIKIDEKTIGKGHPDYANRLNNLAEVYYMLGKYDEAVELFKKAIRIDEKTIGKNHRDHSVRLNNLAATYTEQGKYEEAIGLQKKAMKITEKSLGKEHPEYASRLNNLALVYHYQGKFEEAIELFKQATVIIGNALGKEHPHYAQSMYNLALTYYNQEKYSEALPLFEEALRIREAKLPPEHPYIASAKESLEYCKEMLGGEGSQESS